MKYAQFQSKHSLLAINHRTVSRGNGLWCDPAETERNIEGPLLYNFRTKKKEVERTKKKNIWTHIKADRWRGFGLVEHHVNV